MPNRIISESICTDERINGLDEFEETFFYRLLVNCDDYGRMDARPKLIASRLFPLRDITESEVVQTIEALKRIGLIDIVHIAKKAYIRISDWDTMQPSAGRKTRDYREWRKQVLMRDGYQCQICGKRGGKLNAHHIKRYRNDISGRTDVNNGITVCEECHKEIHRMEGR